METKKIRRRVEDALRKGTAARIYRAAALLGVGCAEQGGHEYAEHECSACKSVFCHSCAGSDNRDQGGKYAPDSMTCPVCGQEAL